MDKILTIEQAKKLAAKYKRDGKTIGFITGCFDILHEGHIDLFRFAKKNVDVLVVALDNNEAIREGKGQGRPINDQSRRSKVLSELSSVDIIIPITERYSFLKKESVESVHDKIRTAVGADFIITTPKVDAYWQSKQKRAEKDGIRIIFFRGYKPGSTTSIIDSLGMN